jgi:pyruvate dehydrogenase E2 component (dihydrolipoyllysine-residue acetyltransferase)
MPPTRCLLVLPDLGLPAVKILAGSWLAEPGSTVIEGDRLLEIVAGSVTVDLPSPASGILIELLVEEDDELEVGQTLAVIEER